MQATVLIACPRPRADPASVAALGDSITARYRLSYSYPDLLGRWRGIPVHNFGVSGDTTAQMLDRLADVLDSGPTPQVVVILGGTNDIARGMPVEGALCPPPSGAFRLDRAQALRAGLRVYARAQGIVFVDPWPAMEDPARRCLRPGELAPLAISLTG